MFIDLNFHDIDDIRNIRLIDFYLNVGRFVLDGHWFAMLTTAWWMMSGVKAVLVKMYVPENDWRVLFSPVLMLFLPFYGFIPFKPHWYQLPDARNNTGA